MDEAVARIVQKKTLKDLAGLRAWLQDHIDGMRRQASSFAAALGALDLHAHALGCCYILFAKATSASAHSDAKLFMDSTENFLISTNIEQIRQHCADRFGAVCHHYTELCRQQRSPGRGVPRLLQALTKLRPHPDYITALHPDFVCLCLLTKQYAVATRVLNETIYEIQPQVTGVTPRDMLLYYYYGGMVFAGLRQWRRAASFFETCVCVPATTLSAIVVEAYKKYVLVNLILHGSVGNLPKHCPVVVSKSVQRFCVEYVGFAAKRQKGVEAAKEHLEANSAVIKKDGNWGLAQQALKALKQQAICRLTLTYDTLSLAAIAQAAGVGSAEDVERMIVAMVEAGDISARIDERNSMVTFVDPEATDLHQRLEDTMERVKEMASRLERLDENVQVSHDYVARHIQKDPSAREEVSTAGMRKGITGMVMAVADAFKG